MVRSSTVLLFFITKVADAARLSTDTQSAYNFFRHKHRLGEIGDTVHLSERRAHFEASAAEVEAHNAQRPDVSWSMAVNKFADYTPEELQQHLGYRRSARISSYGPSAGSFLEIEDDRQTETIKRHSAKSFDWGMKGLKSSKFVKDQGHCGSCWAHAAAGAIEMHLEAQTGNASLISVDQMIDCTPNPRHCGGTGGCSGATAELAFEYAKTKGLALKSDYISEMNHDQCKDASVIGKVIVGGWNRLPENRYEPLLDAVQNKGPVAVSADASKWFMYNGGVFAGCTKDAIINHAVLLVGYGKEESTGQLYWRIRNSWGEQWGEDGHIRILRHDSSDAYCGIDHEPEKGVACEGDPPSLPVCGMCGILADSAHPESLSIK